MENTKQDSWPRAKDADQRVACSYCDCLQAKVEVKEGLDAHCCNCGEILYQNRPHSLQRTISFSMAGLVLLGLALFFPFLSIDERGMTSSMDILGTVRNLWADHGEAMAVGVGVFTIVMPVLLIFSLLYVSIPLLFQRVLPGSVFVFRAVVFFQTWVMVEVFFLGAIVSLIKLVKLAQVDIGIGFWAIGGLMLALAGAMSNVDRMEFWDRIESAQEKLRERKLS